MSEEKEESWWDKAKKLAKRAKNAIVHPFTDRVEGETFSDAFESARRQGKKTFIWAGNEGVYTTEYKGSPQEQMAVYGITNEQLHDRNFIQDRLAKNINPVSYINPVERFFDAVVLNKKDEKRERMDKHKDKVLEWAKVDHRYGFDDDAARLDYFNIYNGIPQSNNTLSISNCKPDNPQYDYCYRDNNLTRSIKDYLPYILKQYDDITDGKFISSNNYENASELDGKILLNKAYNSFYDENHIHGTVYCDGSVKQGTTSGYNLGHYLVTLGKDEKGCYLSYHDVWDISAGRGLVEGLLGKIDMETLYSMYWKANEINTDFGQPFEVYDRIYFDPNTLQPIDVNEPKSTADVKETMKNDHAKAQKMQNNQGQTAGNYTADNRETTQHKADSRSSQFSPLQMTREMANSRC